ncbi:MAG: hypothetical protein ACE5FN_03875 [Leptospirillia bacterium]
MARTFFPEAHRFIPASPPHPEGTQYKVSVGMEDWGGTYQPVIKVQMAKHGQVLGRKSPSYPLETDDYWQVFKAVRELMAECDWPVPGEAAPRRAPSAAPPAATTVPE